MKLNNTLKSQTVDGKNPAMPPKSYPLEPPHLILKGIRSEDQLELADAFKLNIKRGGCKGGIAGFFPSTD